MSESGKRAHEPTHTHTNNLAHLLVLSFAACETLEGGEGWKAATATTAAVLVVLQERLKQKQSESMASNSKLATVLMHKTIWPTGAIVCACVCVCLCE